MCVVRLCVCALAFLEFCLPMKNNTKYKVNNKMNSLDSCLDPCEEKIELAKTGDPVGRLFWNVKGQQFGGSHILKTV